MYILCKKRFYFLSLSLTPLQSHEIDAPIKDVALESPHNNKLGDSSDDKKKKKRSQKKSELSNVINDETPMMSEGYMGGRTPPSNECPLLDKMERRCRGIDILSGDSHQNLLEACGVHQLCYLCVSLFAAIKVGRVKSQLSYNCLCCFFIRF